jgi:hypothetical protein
MWMCGLVISLIIAGAVYEGFARTKIRARLLTIAFLAGGAWIVHCGIDMRRMLMFTMLESEDDSMAETTFRVFTQSDSTLLIDTINNQEEDQNVRFYAACALADKIAADRKCECLLPRVGNAPDIYPVFFSPNEVNKPFFSGGPISVEDLVRRGARTNANAPSNRPHLCRRFSLQN